MEQTYLFNLGDKVKFKDSTKRHKVNKHEVAFRSLHLPSWVFRSEGTVIGFHRRYKWLKFFGEQVGRDRRLPIITFEPKRQQLQNGELVAFLAGFGPYSQKTYIVPSVLLKISSPEPNHPLTPIFL